MAGTLLATIPLAALAPTAIAAGPGREEVSLGLEDGTISTWFLGGASPDPTLGCATPYALTGALRLVVRAECGQ